MSDILMSDYFHIDYTDFDNGCIFDAVLNRDSAFFINIVRLKNASTIEFKDSYNHINKFFDDIATLLEYSSSNNEKDKCYRAALKKFDFSEVNEINLGYSLHKHGNGFGKVLARQVIADAYEIIKKGCKAPELFHLLQLFEDGVGPDRLSDMIATMVLPDIKAYTIRIMKELGINKVNYPNENFDKEGFVINKFKKCPIYFLPIEILHELPVARSWEDVDDVIDKNEAIKREINAEIATIWNKWHSSAKKRYIKENIFMIPEILERVIAEYKNVDLNQLDIKSDIKYYYTDLWKRIKDEFDYTTVLNTNCEINSLDGVKEAIRIFQDWVENNRGWDIVRKSSEKDIQRLIHLSAKEFLERNNLDLSCEPNEGPGPVDFKISRGNDKTIIELKLSSNSDYLHGYEEQVHRYAIAEHTENIVFVMIDNGHSGRRKKLEEKYQQNKNLGNNMPLVYIIDANTQVSASKRT